MEPDVPARALTAEPDSETAVELGAAGEPPGAAISDAMASHQRSRPREYAEAILVAVIFALFARTFLFQAFQVPTSSMEKNILVGDHLIVNKFIFAPHGEGFLSRLLPYRRVRRGDILVFKFPEDPRRDFIKRTIALPGETVEIRDKLVYIEGTRLEESQVYHSDDRVWLDDPALPDSYRRRDQSRPFTVPPGSYFALGDNRDNSYDSRFWGPVPTANLKGRAMFVYWSFPLEPSGHRSVRELVSIALNFFRKTRWDRTLMPVR
ncbi:MAG TPA: signal peptidase I [Thermoanaerobaculia bacterium]|jgi:signal peptidase I|nr:signal peptidase I [Thermoanaerobaculia bacterium]